MHIVYMSLGANIGDKEATLQRAITRIEELIGTVVRRSAFLVTEPWGFRSDNRFVNAAICCTTDMSPERVLEVTQKIERELGRTAKSVAGQYHDRTIDIDLLLYDDLKAKTVKHVCVFSAAVVNFKKVAFRLYHITHLYYF